MLLAVFGITMALGAREWTVRCRRECLTENCAAIAGFFADRSSSRRTPLLVGLVLAFTSTLVFCFARARWLLVVARALQGLSASLIYTAGLALVADTVPAVEVGAW